MIITTAAEMLDLPREERSTYLAAIPRTRTYVFGAMDERYIIEIRKMLLARDAIFREGYRMPGLFVVATFPTHEAARLGSRDLAQWMMDAEAQYLAADEIADYGTKIDDYDQPSSDVPALVHAKDVWLDGDRRLEEVVHNLTETYDD